MITPTAAVTQNFARADDLATVNFVQTLLASRPERVARATRRRSVSMRAVHHRAPAVIPRAEANRAVNASVARDKPVVAIAGGGLWGCACAYFCQRTSHCDVVIVERSRVASAASGKGGGFLARDWGDGTPTAPLHKRAFELHETLAEELLLETYRKIPTLSVLGGSALDGGPTPLVSWLDGDIQMCRMMDEFGTAQVTPKELCEKLHDAAVRLGATCVKGEVTGVTFADDGAKVRGLVYKNEDDGTVEEIEADHVVVAMGPWATRASEWFGIKVPMTGIRSTSVMYEASEAVMREPAALFCGEDENGCHLEVYPRSTGEVYICGIGGSQYIDEERLLPGGDCDRSEKIVEDPSRVAAAMRSFGGMSRSIGGDGKAPLVTQACMRPCAPDALPILGPVDGIENAYMATAGNCWGILWSPVAGEIIADLITKGKSSIDIKPFSPTRFMQRGARGRGRKMRSEEVGEQW